MNNLHSVFTSNDGLDVNTQSEQAKAYFEAVESILEELCKTNGWQLDTSKVSCIRLKIQANAHMDIPLYAVPDSMFHSFQEKNEMKLSAESAKFDSIDKNRDWLALDESFIDFSEEESLRDMDIQTIHMAKRDGEWQSKVVSLRFGNLAAIYHMSIYWRFGVIWTSAILYLCLPVSISPALLLLPIAFICVLMHIQAKYLKKYL